MAHLLRGHGTRSTARHPHGVPPAAASPLRPSLLLPPLFRPFPRTRRGASRSLPCFPLACPASLPDLALSRHVPTAQGVRHPWGGLRSGLWGWGARVGPNGTALALPPGPHVTCFDPMASHPPFPRMSSLVSDAPLRARLARTARASLARRSRALHSLRVAGDTPDPNGAAACPLCALWSSGDKGTLRRANGTRALAPSSLRANGRGVGGAGFSRRGVSRGAAPLLPLGVLVSGPAAPLVGFTGSRRLSSAFAPLVGAVVASVVAGGHGVAVGCAAGADQLVRQAAPGALVFSASSFAAPGLPPRAALVARSAALVAAVAASAPGAALVGFVASPCPAGLMPSPRAGACFAGRGSGSWASLALAAGLGVPVVVFCCGVPPVLPAWPGGTWAPAAPSGVWAAGWRWWPPQQLALPL